MLEELRPRAGADLQQLQAMFEEQGWYAALPSSMPDQLLLALARDLRVLELISDPEGHSLSLASAVFAAMYLMMENPARNLGAGHEFHLSENGLNHAMSVYQCAIEREIVTRITGLASGTDMSALLRAFESLRSVSWSEEAAVRVLNLFRETSGAGESIPIWVVAKLTGCSSSHLLETYRRFGNAPVCDDDSVQAYLRSLILLTSNVYELAQSLEVATAWLRSEPIPEFDGLTAMEVVAAGRGVDLTRLIDIYAAGLAG